MYQVLIVDDEKLMRDALSAMVLQTEGFQIAGACETGEMAVTFCREHPVDIVFMDILMPGISGIEASRRLSEECPRLSIYILSACSNFASVKAALSAKIKDYLTKPISFSMIRSLLREYQETKNTDEVQRDALLTVLDGHQYQTLSEAVSKTVRTIYKKEGRNSERLMQRFMGLGREILSTAEPMGESGEGIEERFPISTVFQAEDSSWMFWLYDVMDYAFQMQAVAKCQHLKSVFAEIEREIKKDINLRKLSDQCSISQSYLSKLFKQNLGVSVMDYIHLRKLKRAKMYLLFTNMSTGDIAYRMGYNEGSYFSKVFKKYEGITPQQYKNQFSKAS